MAQPSEAQLCDSDTGGAWRSCVLMGSEAPYSIEDVVRFFVPPVLLRVDVWILIAAFVVSPRKTYLAASVLACAFFAYRSQLTGAAPLASWQLGGALLAVLCAAGLLRNLLCAHRRNAADVARGRARSRSFRYKGSGGGPPGDNPAAQYSYSTTRGVGAGAGGASAAAPAAAPTPVQPVVAQTPSPAAAPSSDPVATGASHGAVVDAHTTNGTTNGTAPRSARDRTSSRSSRGSRRRTASRGSAAGQSGQNGSAPRRMDAHRAAAAGASEVKTEEPAAAAAAEAVQEPPARKAVTVPPSELPLRMPMGPPTQGEHCFSLLDGSTFAVRGVNYMKDGVKVRCATLPCCQTSSWSRVAILTAPDRTLRRHRYRRFHRWPISCTWTCSRQAIRLRAWRHTRMGTCRRRLPRATRDSSSRSRSRCGRPPSSLATVAPPNTCTGAARVLRGTNSVPATPLCT